ncbi:MAG: 30S ribosomal protein S8 [Candidatus Omnitrophica bacterium]|nr:30S ribosomal protein S8 [Candidatus Omnitrophota bacterium]
MSIADPIANFLTLIRNASSAKQDIVDCPSSRTKEAISQMLKIEGFIKNFKKIDDKKQGVIRIYLKYGKGKEKPPVITNLQRVSMPGRRVYKKVDEIKSVFGGIGIAIISTSKGLKTDKECREAGIGGEVLCRIW